MGFDKLQTFKLSSRRYFKLKLVKLSNFHSVRTVLGSSNFKKGDHENPEIYRPIRLLNVSYKLMAYIIHDRICSKLDQYLGHQQAGFRKGRSTLDPLYCVRRLQDLVEKGHDKLVMILLDWEIVFR